MNRELVLLYWDIGRGIVEKQQTAGWGESVVERLAADLRAEFPDMRGFSLANLWRMKQFYLAHSSPEFLAQTVREINAEKSSLKNLSQAVRDFVHHFWGRALVSTVFVVIIVVGELALAVPRSHVFMACHSAPFCPACRA